MGALLWVPVAIVLIAALFIWVLMSAQIYSQCDEAKTKRESISKWITVIFGPIIGLFSCLARD